MGLIIASIVINSLLTLTTAQQMPGIEWLFGPAVALQVIGLGISLAGSKKIGAPIVMIGSIVFIPIGLIGFFGARKMLQAENDKAMARAMAQ